MLLHYTLIYLYFLILTSVYINFFLSSIVLPFFCRIKVKDPSFNEQNNISCGKIYFMCQIKQAVRNTLSLADRIRRQNVLTIFLLQGSEQGAF